MVAPLYVSGLLLRVTRIGVKACIDVTLYAELFITSIIEKHVLSPFQVLQDIIDAVQCSLPGLLWYLPTKLTPRFTSGLVHSMAYIIDPMAEAYGILLILLRSSDVEGL